jgi:hypothetical protein
MTLECIIGYVVVQAIFCQVVFYMAHKSCKPIKYLDEKYEAFARHDHQYWNLISLFPCKIELSINNIIDWLIMMPRLICTYMIIITYVIWVQ